MAQIHVDYNDSHRSSLAVEAKHSFEDVWNVEFLGEFLGMVLYVDHAPGWRVINKAGMDERTVYPTRREAVEALTRFSIREPKAWILARV